ncbi:MAG: cation diffusion facilitator family transporter [Myxococcales bacterium]|nr:cation diffusion facilitator family transporter [Myxococcales bacterium]
MAAAGNLRVLLISFLANVGIALAKGAAALFTGSGAMAAEAIHSAADSINQVLLYLGHRESQLGPSDKHPLGRGQAVYFWSFLVALMIFLGGGVLSIREGIHKLQHPEPIADAWVAFVVLGVSLLLEGTAATQALRAAAKLRRGRSFFEFLRTSRSVDLVVLVTEDSAAVLGLLFAGIALAMTKLTGDARWDAAGSIAIGLLLCAVALWLARKVKSLLEGESADPSIVEAFREEAAREPAIVEILRVFTVQQGPRHVVLAAKVRMRDGLSNAEAVRAINALERRMHGRSDVIAFQFVEPDVEV